MGYLRDLGWVSVAYTSTVESIDNTACIISMYLLESDELFIKHFWIVYKLFAYYVVDIIF